MNTYKKKVFLLLGSNLGESLDNLTTAKARVEESVGQIVNASSFYKTEPWGRHDQPWFLNQAVSIECIMEPHTLLDALEGIERSLGRQAGGHWQPRVIDIDILFYENQIINDKELVIPHPYIPLRRFALTPLAEIAPDFVHPSLNIPVIDLLAACDDPLRVERLDL